MAIRSRQQQQEDAERILAEYLASTQVGGDEDSQEPSLPMPTSLLGKITTVVTSDATYGPHLVVQPQEYTGVPPTAADSITSTIRTYPTPNHVVGDYAVDEFVAIQILAQSDAYVAVKLS